MTSLERTLRCGNFPNVTILHMEMVMLEAGVTIMTIYFNYANASMRVEIGEFSTV